MKNLPAQAPRLKQELKNIENKSNTINSAKLPITIIKSVITDENNCVNKLNSIENNAKHELLSNKQVARTTISNYAAEANNTSKFHTELLQQKLQNLRNKRTAAQHESSEINRDKDITPRVRP